jgi:signal transduction histidine kinase/DNA-binding response OmpR family regulator
MLTHFVEKGRRLFFPPRYEDRHEDFRRVLLNAINVGLRVAGGLALVAVAVYLLGKIGIGGASPRWTIAPSLPPDEVLVLDKVLIVALGTGAFAAGCVGLSLGRGRLLGAGFGVIIGLASLYGDVLRGDLGLGYLTTTFVTTVILIPFRPWQTFLIGTSLTALLLGVDPLMRPALGLPAINMVKGEVVQMTVVILLMTTISAVLYRRRYRQYKAFREAKALSEKLAETERAKNRFFANLSHELRTPLTLLLGPLQDALEGQYGDLPVSLQRSLRRMEEQAQRLRRLINQLLRLSELDEGQMELEVRPIGASQFLDRMASLFRSMADQEGVDVRVEADADVQVWADPEALRQIISNLLKNALEHTPEGGAVRLRAQPQEERSGADEEQRVAISVRDSGPGLPDEVQDDLFDRYVGASSDSHDSVDVTTGIGLAVVGELVERHGGSVEVETEQSFGTEITAFLPDCPSAVPDEDLASDLSVEEPDRVDEAVDPAVRRSEDALPETDSSISDNGESGEVDRKETDPASGEPLVLVADDEEAVREYLRDVLTPPYAVRTAPDGEEALEVAQEEPPDLVISDVKMPRRDGFELCQALRENGQLQSVPIILLTVQKREESRMEGLRRGADAYLEKPFHPGELRQRAENLIGVRQYIRSEARQDLRAGEGEVGPKGTTGGTGPARQQSFADEARDVVESHLDNSNFGVDWLAEEMSLSPRQLQRRLKGETGLSAAAFIRAVRLERAAELLRDGTVDTVKAAASAVGYRDPSHFSQLFKEAHGRPPSEFKS